ncbi:MAG: hypothetical protein M3N43_05530 [Actinomycetota bacterium]|nr:hypothetical protein [Actinomycetota bacterium]
MRPAPTTSEARGIPDRIVTRLVWVVAAIALGAIGLGSLSALELGEFGSTFVGLLAGIGYTVALASFALSGALIVSKQPWNVTGWLLIIPGLAIPFSELALDWLVALEPAPSSADPFLWLVLWLTSWSWVLLIFPVFHLLLTFPNGKFLSPRWRWAGWLEGAMVATMMAAAAFGEPLQLMVEDETIWSLPNPIGFISEAFFEEGGFFDSVWTPALLVLTVASVTAVVMRFRTGTREERLQLKWPLVAVALFGLVYGGGAAFDSAFIQGGVGDLLFGYALAAIPIAVAIAVLRYRLYEIDRIVSRTVSYAVSVGVLTSVFIGAVTLLSSLLSAQSDLAIAGSTLTVATLFNPVRKRVQGGVDRRFNRSRYDAQRVMDRFAGSLRQQVDSDEVVRGWVGVVSETMQPTVVAVWVRGGR